MNERDLELEILTYLYNNREKSCNRDELFNLFSNRISQEICSKIEYEMRSVTKCFENQAVSNSYKISEIGIQRMNFIKSEIVKEKNKEDGERKTLLWAKVGSFGAIIATALWLIVYVFKPM
ncbi:MAG TPA: hypothetical protein VF411_14495 [Bacteroidia bacterium]